MKILVVDDSKSAREPIELHLMACGHEVFTASDGIEGLTLFLKREFDLVISDIRMPNMNGLEMLSKIKEEKPEQDVMMVTGYGDMESTLEALRCGASNYLLKPIILEELAMAVRTIERRQEMVKQLKEQEAKLAQARKMADLGLVAAGVAHEINNPTTFIRGNIQTLSKFWDTLAPFCAKAIEAGVDPPSKMNFIMEEIPHMLEAMFDGTERIRKIVENTAIFALANNDDIIDPVNLNQCVEKALSQFSLDERQIIVLFFEQNLPMVRASEEGLIEVMQELLHNSIKATRYSPNPRIQVTTSLDAHNHPFVEIADNGSGIRTEDQSLVFTPFFTTDPRIGRPGLGLSKVYALVRSFGGEISFHSKMDNGTRFTVKLKSY